MKASRNLDIRYRLPWIAVVAMIINGCSIFPMDNENRIAFTDELREQWNFTDDEIKSLQFYVHSDVLISRQFTEGSRSIVRGKLISRSGKQIDEIELRAGTPGIVKNVYKNSLRVCFEGDCSATLVFGCSNDCKSWKGKYSSFAQEWDDGVGKINYGGETYWLEPATYIEIDKEALAKVQRKRRVIEGKLINSKE